MNFCFDGMSYKELFHTLFETIAIEYNLIIDQISDNGMELKSKGFILSFDHDIDTVWIYYTDLIQNKTYLLSNYINTNATDTDRENLPEAITIAENIKATLIIQLRILKSKFSNLLDGNKEWFEEYK